MLRVRAIAVSTLTEQAEVEVVLGSSPVLLTKMFLSLKCFTAAGSPSRSTRYFSFLVSDFGSGSTSTPTSMTPGMLCSPR